MLSPAENTYLWRDGAVDIEIAVRALLTLRGSEAFRRLELRRDYVHPLGGLVGEEHRVWLASVTERYLPEPIAPAADR